MFLFSYLSKHIMIFFLFWFYSNYPKDQNVNSCCLTSNRMIEVAISGQKFKKKNS